MELSLSQVFPSIPSVIQVTSLITSSCINPTISKFHYLEYFFGSPWLWTLHVPIPDEEKKLSKIFFFTLLYGASVVRCLTKKFFVVLFLRHHKELRKEKFSRYWNDLRIRERKTERNWLRTIRSLWRFVFKRSQNVSIDDVFMKGPYSMQRNWFSICCKLQMKRKEKYMYDKCILLLYILQIYIDTLSDSSKHKLAEHLHHHYANLQAFQLKQFCKNGTRQLLVNEILF